MKRYLKVTLCVMAFLFLKQANAQQKTYFEGDVYYRHYIEMKDTTANEWDIIHFYGSESLLSVKNGNYKWVFSNSSLEEEVYNVKDNKVYNKFMKNDTIYWVSPEVEGEKILQMYPIKKNNDTIINTPCDLLLVKSQLGDTQEVRGRMYYFSDKFPINPENYKNLKMNNQNAIYNTMKAIPLRIVVVHKQYRVIYEVHSIKPKALDDKLFQIDKTKPSRKL